MSDYIGLVVGVLAVVLYLIAGFPLASRRIAASSAFGLRSADTDGDDQIWYLANAAVGRALIWTAGVCGLLTVVAIVYLGDEDVQSALVVALFLTGLAGAISAIGTGLTTARALGKAKQAIPPNLRRT